MIRFPAAWLARHRRALMPATIALLLAVVAVESFLLFVQGSVRREIDAQSDSLLARFLDEDTTRFDPAAGVPIRLEHVRFLWSDRVYIDAGNLAVRAAPLRGSVVDFDDLDSFVMLMQQSDVHLSIGVLEGMLNESVFNYPGSKLRDLHLKFREDDGARVLHLTGSIKMPVWIPFSMDMALRLDRGTNTIVVDGSHFKVLGVLSVSRLLKLEPLQLEHLLSMPPNQSLMVDDNRLMIKPFGLFPPPRINGKMTSVRLEGDGIRIEFGGQAVPAPESAAPNYVYLRGGASKFGNFSMLETDLLIVDQDPHDSFVFSLKHYAEMVPKSAIEVRGLNAARVEMPDYGESPRLATRTTAGR